MARWEFKALSFDVSGKQVFADLSLWQKERIDSYVRALETARKSPIANPIFSNFYVREGIGIAGGEMFPAGNLEYGFCQALHAEEFAVAALRLNGGDSIGSEIILGIIAGKPGDIVTPCGNCRDIMLQYFSQTAEIISGSSEGGIAVVASLASYLREDFQVIKPADIMQNLPWIIEETKGLISTGKMLTNDAYSPDNIRQGSYYAKIVTVGGSYYGAHDVMCDYHPIYALRDAVRQARRANDSIIRYVLIACEGINDWPPHVMYKDRQHLFELNLQGELVFGEERDPIVYLATRKENGETVFWKTSVKEWLPWPFSSRDFGPGFITYLAKYFKTHTR